MLFYLKFHCELNHIKYFGCDGKSWTRKNCKYSIEGLKKDISKALSQIQYSKTLRHNKSCLKKMELYRKKIQYGMGE